MKDVLEKLDKKEDLFKPFKIGEIIEGEIIGMEKAAVFLDLGIQGTGIIYGKEFFEAKEILKNQKIGDKLSAKVIAPDNDEGFIELSITQAGEEIAWQKFLQQQKEGKTIKIKILKANKGGLIAGIRGIPAFLPVSQLSPEHYPKVKGGDSSQILKELQKFIGQELEVKILTLNPKNNQIILSEKAKEAEKIKEILKNYNVGNIVEGEITGVVDFGVFIKFLQPEIQKAKKSSPGKEKFVEPEASGSESPAIEGLIHISELDWKIIEDPLEIVKVGQKVKAKIIEITDGRVSLSLKALKKDPWEGIEEKYKKGDIVSGKVKKFNPFGVFIQITPQVQGLCHISEFSSPKNMADCLKVGEKYKFKILLIEPKDHRMTLKLERE